MIKTKTLPWNYDTKHRYVNEAPDNGRHRRRVVAYLGSQQQDHGNDHVAALGALIKAAPEMQIALSELIHAIDTQLPLYVERLEPELTGARVALAHSGHESVEPPSKPGAR